VNLPLRFVLVARIASSSVGSERLELSVLRLRAACFAIKLRTHVDRLQPRQGACPQAREPRRSRFFFASTIQLSVLPQCRFRDSNSVVHLGQSFTGSVGFLTVNTGALHSRAPARNRTVPCCVRSSCSALELQGQVAGHEGVEPSERRLWRPSAVPAAHDPSRKRHPPFGSCPEMRRAGRVSSARLLIRFCCCEFQEPGGRLLQSRLRTAGVRNDWVPCG
jgi:hypothetical protein